MNNACRRIRDWFSLHRRDHGTGPEDRQSTRSPFYPLKPRAFSMAAVRAATASVNQNVFALLRALNTFSVGNCTLLWRAALESHRAIQFFFPLLNLDHSRKFQLLRSY